MIKKYEIITVGTDKRIKALRSFRVQDRFVNVGDVGGIVYDENTLSQEGNCWIFSGNLNYPSIRVEGDSIVDTNGYEGAVTDPRPFVNVTGTSALIGAHDFVTGKVSAAKVLAVGAVEQGDVSDIIGTKYDESKVVNANAIRLKSLIYMGGISATVTLAGEGYEMKVLRYGADKKLVSVSEWGNSGGTSAANYIGIIIRKTPTAATAATDATDATAATVPADITAAKVTIPSTAIEGTINIKDSRIVFNYTSAMTVATKVNPSSASFTAMGLNSNITASNVAIRKAGNRDGVMNIFADIDHCNVTVSALTTLSAIIGTFKNVNSLVLDGSLAWGDPSAAVRGIFNFVDCDTVVYTSEVFPTSTITSVVTARMPLTFIRCNVERGLFYHNAVNRNVYTDIDFGKALTDLSEPLANDDHILASGERQGMYRVVSKSTRAMGPLVEGIHSVKNLNLTAVGANTQSVEIYKDAYLDGVFTLEGSQVYGGSFGHDRSTDLKPHMVAVRGEFNTQEVGQIITGKTANENTMIIATPVRVNGPHGMEIDGLTGSGVTATLAFTDIRGKIAAVNAYSTDMPKLTEDDIKFHQAYITFSKAGSPVTEDDLKGIVIRTFNGCKVVNTKEAAAVVKGSVRVEDNAAVYDSEIDGSGYFGGNSVTENAAVVGSIYVADNGVFAPAAEEGKSDSDIRIVDNAKFLAASRSMNNVMHMDGDSEFSGTIAVDTLSIVMHDRSRMAGSVSGKGLLILEDDADTSDKGIGAHGIICLVGSYRQTGAKTWTGNRTIGSESEPTYENNVKTKYDF